jgi:hypothetical protein
MTPPSSVPFTRVLDVELRFVCARRMGHPVFLYLADFFSHLSHLSTP